MTPGTARSRSRTHARTSASLRSSPASPRAPRGPRRISGPVARRAVAASAGAATLPRRGTTSDLPRFARHRLRLGRIRALPEHRVVDRLLRSRLWIWALGALLGGIVTMQVSLLKLNSGISRAVETTTTLERQNADLEASIARLSSPDRIEAGATTLGMVMPPAGDVGYLTPGPNDAVKALRRMEPPSEDAAALLANNGIVPGSLAATEVATPVLPAATPVAPAATPVAPAATPVAPAATPEPTAAPPTTTVPTTTEPTGAPPTAAPATTEPAVAGQP
jgi:cell division protein FtsL